MESFRKEVLFQICSIIDGNHPDDVPAGAKQEYNRLANEIVLAAKKYLLRRARKVRSVKPGVRTGMKATVGKRW